MASQDDIDRISSLAEKTEDVSQLKQYRQELLAIAANMAQVIAQTTDTGVQEHAQGIKESAEYAAQDIGARATQLEIDQMDPDYERRKAEREQFEAQEQARQQQEAQESLKKLSGLVGGLLGGRGGGGLGGLFGGAQQPTEAQQAGAAASPGTADQPAPPTATACMSCGEPITGSPKFCPNCGAPTKNTCNSCGQEIEGSPKFCPNCGTPTA